MQQAAGATLPPPAQQLPGRLSSGEACPRAPPPCECSPPSTDAARVAAALGRLQQALQLQQEAAHSLQACAINATATAAAAEAGDGAHAPTPLASPAELYLAYDRRHTNALFDGAQGGGWQAERGATHVVLRTATEGSAGSASVQSMLGVGASDEQELLPGLAGRSSSRGEPEGMLRVVTNSAFGGGP